MKTPNDERRQPLAPWTAIDARAQEDISSELHGHKAGTAFMLWFRVCLEAGKAGSLRFKLSMSALAYACGMTRETARLRLQDLARLGFIAIEPTRTPDGTAYCDAGICTVLRPSAAWRSKLPALAETPPPPDGNAATPGGNAGREIPPPFLHSQNPLRKNSPPATAGPPLGGNRETGTQADGHTEPPPRKRPMPWSVGIGIRGWTAEDLAMWKATYPSVDIEKAIQNLSRHMDQHCMIRRLKNVREDVVRHLEEQQKAAENAGTSPAK